MKQFRKIIFWSHLLAGVIAGVVVFVMSVTGVLLAFEAQITRFAERDQRTVQPLAPGTPRLSPQALLAKVQADNPTLKPAGLTVEADPTAAVSVSLGRDGTLFVNPYTGASLGTGSKGVRNFFHEITDWHRWLGAHGENRSVGRAITGACNAAFLFLAISGIYIWWPKKWTRQHLAAITLFRSGLKGKARDFNWHNVIGIWCVLVLIVLTATGMVISYQWANNLIYTITGSPRPGPPPGAGGPGPGGPGGPGGQGSPNAGSGQQRREGNPNAGGAGGPGPVANQGGPSSSAQSQPVIPTNLDQLWQRAEQQVSNWNVISLRLATSATAPVSFSIDDGTSWNPIGRSQLTLNQTTAEVVRWEPYVEYSLGRKLRLWVRTAHTGEAAGLPGQIVACVASLGGAFLVWTGIALSWRRFLAWKTKRAPQKSHVKKDEVEVTDLEPKTLA